MIKGLFHFSYKLFHCIMTNNFFVYGGEEVQTNKRDYQYNK